MGQATRRQDGAGATMLDLWLRRSLSDSYGAAIAEPLPPELASLVAAVPEREHEARAYAR